MPYLERRKIPTQGGSSAHEGQTCCDECRTQAAYFFLPRNCPPPISLIGGYLDLSILSDYHIVQK